MKFEISNDELRPLVRAVVAETLQAIETTNAKLGGDRLGFTEAEAAGLIGVQKHTLRDARLRGEISGRLVGKRIVYARDELVRFLKEQ